MLDAGKKPSAIDSATIQKRNLHIDKQLLDNNLLSAEIEGDGNYVHRVLSYSLNDRQSNYSQLRKSIAQHLLNYHGQIFGVRANS